MAKEVATGKKDLAAFLIDTQEEIMDALLYIEAAKACLQEEIEDCYINDKFEDVKGIELYDEEEIETEVARKYWESVIRQTSVDETTSSNVKDEPTNPSQ